MKNKVVDYFKQNGFDYVSKTININYSIKNINVLYGEKKKGIATVKIDVYFLHDIISAEQLEVIADYISKNENGNLCLALCDSGLNFGKKYGTYIADKSIIHFAYIDKEQHSVAFDFDFHYHQSKYIIELVRFIEKTLAS